MKYKLFFLVLIPITIFFFSCSAGDFELEEVGLFEYTGDKNYKSPNYVEVSAAKNQYNTDIDGNPNGNDSLPKDWYKDSVFYHIWVKSFSDSIKNDNCGDLKGIEDNLDYIQNDLGCDAIWLSPIFSCSYVSIDGNMHGYDTIDYYSINDLFGTLEDLDSLISAVHKRKMKIIFDFVPNHTSNNHSWFLNSQNKDNSKRDWYLWNDEKLYWHTGMHDNTWHKKDSEYYYGAFNNTMPDLNFRNYEVREEMKNVVRYWLNKGFDGLRIDAARYLIENENEYCDTKETHDWYRELRKEVLDEYESPKFMVCEAWIEEDRNRLNEYFGTQTEPEFNMVFDFDAGKPCIYSVRDNFDNTGDTLNPIKPNDNSVFGTFLGNHDEYCGRVGSVLGLQDKFIKQATALSLLRPTVPFIYYGNEIGQSEASISGDFRLRFSMNFQEAEKQKNDPLSILNLNKTILSLRKEHPELRTGTVTKLESLDKNTDEKSSYLAYNIEHSSSQNKFLCVYNFSNKSVGNIEFKQNSFSSNNKGICVIGDKNDTLEFTDNKVIFTNLAPYSYRLYYVGDDDTVENIFDDEDYIEDDVYNVQISTMYLRGSMNDWSLSDSMSKTVENGKIIYTIDIHGNRADSGSFVFKFDTGFWYNGYNWGIEKFNDDRMSGTLSSEQNKDNNIIVSNIDSRKTYTITFNFTDLTFSVKEKEN